MTKPERNLLVRTAIPAVAALFAFHATGIRAADPAPGELELRFKDTVRPFLADYCVACHGGQQPAAQFDLTKYSTTQKVAEDHNQWSLLSGRLTAKEMPPKGAKQPPDELRQKVADWANALIRHEARKKAGDPGLVLARRLSNAEYNYTIRDLTGVDMRPGREFPVDPSNQAGFDNSGESLAMSPSLLNKYLQAAREVAGHMVLKPDGFAFAPHEIIAFSDRDKYSINQILDFYRRQNTDYAGYFQTAWRYKHRVALGTPRATLASLAGEFKVSPKYLATVWRFLEETKEEVGPGARLQSMWRALPVPKGKQTDLVKAETAKMRDFVVQIRKKTMTRVVPISAGRGGAGGRVAEQPAIMWRNRRYAENRMRFDATLLQVDGEPKPAPPPPPAGRRSTGQDDAVEEGNRRTPAPRSNDPDPDLQVPAGQRAVYEAAFGRFTAVFPDAFYISERGRFFPEVVTEGHLADNGRFLSAGFVSGYGFFRDDRPLYELLLDQGQQHELDRFWLELDFSGAAHRTFIQAHRGEARALAQNAAPQSAENSDPQSAENQNVTVEANVKLLGKNLVDRLRAANAAPVMIQVIEEHYASANESLRRVEKVWKEAEPLHLDALRKFAARAFRRPLMPTEREEVTTFYQSLRSEGLSHEDAMRDSIVRILASPYFCYRADIADADSPAANPQRAPRTAAAKPVAAPQSNLPGVVPLPDYALASRLSYFLWSSMPDDALMAHAAAGDLRKPDVILAQARRMLKDRRSDALATEFIGNWLDFRRFEEHNSVDRERFPSFNNDLRQAMFEEPVRFAADLIHNNRSVLEFLYANHTFVNPVLAKHYGITGVPFQSNEWVKLEPASRYQRGGLLPMAVFLTKNAPGLRTSPVKRGYWVVRRVLGEVIPPPPAMVPELPRDEAKLELPLRDVLARHRQDPSCAGCHTRFDSFGLAMEGYGPVGEARTTDLAGRAVDARAEFPNGGSGIGLEGLREYIRTHRQNDFIDNLCRKFTVYALGRGLMLSDEPAIEAMRTKLAANGYRFNVLVDSIVTSPQFLTRREPVAQEPKGN